MIELTIYLIGLVIGIVVPFIYKPVYNSLKGDEENTINYTGCVIIWPIFVAVVIVSGIFWGVIKSGKYLLRKRWGE